VVSSPQISIGPAGCRINRDYARRGWAAKASHPRWGPGTRVRMYMPTLLQAAQAPDKQRGQRCGKKRIRLGGVEGASGASAVKRGGEPEVRPGPEHLGG